MPATVYDYFQRAFRRTQSRSGSPGEVICDSDGNRVVFWIEVAAGRVSSASYKCTTCMTLVAFCEHLAELVQGKAVIPFPLAPEDLIRAHPEVPAERRDRALLAVRALQSAVDNSCMEVIR